MSTATDVKTCSFGKCERKHYAKGWCEMHYQRDRQGTPMDAPVQVKIRGRKCSVPTCDRPHDRHGLCKGHWHRHDRGVPLDDRPIGKIKEKPKYHGMHNRLRNWRGPASDHECQECGKQARHWAYTHDDPNALEQWVTGQNGRKYLVQYSTDFNCYVPLCVPCHVSFDRGR